MFGKKQKVLVPLKWSLLSEESEDAVVVLIGEFLNGGHLYGGSYYGGDYYEPYYTTLPLQKMRAYFPIRSGGQTKIYALVLSEAELMNFQLDKEVRAPKGLNTNANPVVIRPFPVAWLKETIEKEDKEYSPIISYSGEYYKDLQMVWE